MQQHRDGDARVALWLERIVWNAAAGAALAVMILVLLTSLRWLDQWAPQPRTPPPAVSAPAAPAEVTAGTHGSAHPEPPNEERRVTRIE